jgi:hypothetical protein
LVYPPPNHWSLPEGDALDCKQTLMMTMSLAPWLRGDILLQKAMGVRFSLIDVSQRETEAKGIDAKGIEKPLLFYSSIFTHITSSL